MSDAECTLYSNDFGRISTQIILGMQYMRVRVPVFTISKFSCENS